jgi:MbtH protein
LTNLFDDDDSLHVLRNRVGEFSFWPAHAALPDGWEVALAAASRPEAEGYVREHWTTLTPVHRVRSHGADGSR